MEIPVTVTSCVASLYFHGGALGTLTANPTATAIAALIT
jgi:hypothetical protein